MRRGRNRLSACNTAAQAPCACARGSRGARQKAHLSISPSSLRMVSSRAFTGARSEKKDSTIERGGGLCGGQGTHGQSHAGESAGQQVLQAPKAQLQRPEREGRRTDSRKKPDPGAPCVVEWSSTEPRSASKALLRVEVPGPMGARTDADGIGKEVMKRRPPSSMSDDLHEQEKKKKQNGADPQQRWTTRQRCQRARSQSRARVFRAGWPSAVFD